MNKKQISNIIRLQLEKNKVFREYPQRFALSQRLANMVIKEDGNLQPLLDAINTHYVITLCNMSLLVGYLTKKYNEYLEEGEYI